MQNDKSLREALGVLSKSSPQAVEVERSEQNHFKEYLFITTKIEEDFASCLNSLHPGEIIFLCGSSGDGKSAILTRYSQSYQGKVHFHLDATHSLNPSRDAIEELDLLFDDLSESNKPLVIGINIGMMANYAEGGSEDHSHVRSSMADYLAKKYSESKYYYFDFERYPKFKFQDHCARSEFTEKFLERLTQKDNNPFIELLIAQEKLDQDNIVCVNYRLLCIPVVQRSIVDALMKARLIRDQFMTSRALLDFIHHLLTGPGYLFDNLFTAADNELSQAISHFDPAINRTKRVDHFLLEYDLGLTGDDFMTFKKEMHNFGIVAINKPSSFIRFFYLLRGDDFSNNYHHCFESDFSNSLLEHFAKIWKLHEGFNESPSGDEKRDILEFYNGVLLKGLRRYMNRKSPELKDKLYFISESNGVVFIANLRVQSDFPALIKSSVEGLSTTTFHGHLKVGQRSLSAIPINISLFSLLLKLNQGYRPNKHDKSTVLILDELVDQISEIANQESALLVYDGNHRYEIEQSDDDFVVARV